MTLTAAQVRAARALLRWTTPWLARTARISFAQALRVQEDDGMRTLGGLDLRAIRGAMEAFGSSSGRTALSGCGGRHD